MSQVRLSYCCERFHLAMLQTDAARKRIILPWKVTFGVSVWCWNHWQSSSIDNFWMGVDCNDGRRGGGHRTFTQETAVCVLYGTLSLLLTYISYITWLTYLSYITDILILTQNIMYSLNEAKWFCCLNLKYFWWQNLRYFVKIEVYFEKTVCVTNGNWHAVHGHPKLVSEEYLEH